MSLVIRDLGLQDYEPVWKQMQSLTLARDEHTVDECWLLQHPPVYTLGLNGKRVHLLRDNGIPVVAVDRGGQVTYHGPGQLVTYMLCDLPRLGLGVNTFVNRLEQSLIDLLDEFAIRSHRKTGAPGVYVDDCKIAALGLRVKHGRSYHGLSLNVDMDLSPFADINPCGHPRQRVTQLKDLGIHKDITSIQTYLVEHLRRNLGYNDAS